MLTERQTFINGTVLFKVLERPQFGVATSHLFPIYFSLQTALPVVLAITYPGSKNAFGVPSSISGFLDSSNRWSVLVPVTVMFITGLANLVWLLPATTNCLAERRLQGM